jgi:hypothetical protein
MVVRIPCSTPNAQGASRALVRYVGTILRQVGGGPYDCATRFFFQLRGSLVNLPWSGFAAASRAFHSGGGVSGYHVTCWSCGNSWEFSPPLGRGESCLKCRRDAKVCLNCSFYERHLNRECTESQAELVKDKEKSNFCDWFDAKHVTSNSGVSDVSVSPLDQLFGGSSSPKAKSDLELEMDAFFAKKK